MWSNKKAFGLVVITCLVVGSAWTATAKSGGQWKRYPANADAVSDYPALALQGDTAKGQVAYKACIDCHLANGAGKKDGSFPQIAGQHTAVLIKQLTDIREKRRVNPAMDEISRKLTDNQELANLVAYIQTLKIPRDNGKGANDPKELSLGQQLYQRDCVQCHGSFGEGDAKKFYPVVAGQHYEYVLRQLKAVKDTARGNSHPEMVRLVKGYSEKEMKALSNYVSLLVWPMRSGN
jgi:cytochrome c553